MRTTRVALYDIKSGNFNDIASKAKAGMVPLFQESQGFVTYGVAQIDKQAFVSLSTWETRAQADAASTKAADWVKTNIGDQVNLRESYVGDLTIDAGTRDPELIAH
jgi:heme-degrading monooxygenase HmoA